MKNRFGDVVAAKHQRLHEAGVLCARLDEKVRQTAEDSKSEVRLPDSGYSQNSVFGFYDLKEVRRAIQKAGWKPFSLDDSVVSIFDGATPNNWDRLKWSNNQFSGIGSTSTSNPEMVEDAIRQIVYDILIRQGKQYFKIHDVVALDHEKYIRYFADNWKEMSESAGDEGFYLYFFTQYFDKIANYRANDNDVKKLGQLLDVQSEILSTSQSPDAIHEVLANKKDVLPEYIVDYARATRNFKEALASMSITIGGKQRRVRDYLVYNDPNIVLSAAKKEPPASEYWQKSRLQTFRQSIIPDLKTMVKTAAQGSSDTGGSRLGHMVI